MGRAGESEAFEMSLDSYEVEWLASPLKRTAVEKIESGEASLT